MDPERSRDRNPERVSDFPLQKKDARFALLAMVSGGRREAGEAAPQAPRGGATAEPEGIRKIEAGAAAA